MRKTTVLGVAGAWVAATCGIGVPPSHAEVGVEVEGMTFNGSGCPVGTAATALSPDGQAVTISFSEYQVGLPTTAFSRSKNCSFSALVTVPDGYTASIGAIDYRGFQDLRGDGTLTLYTRANLGGEDATTEEYDLGDLPQSWHVHDAVTSSVRTPCGPTRQAMFLNTRLNMRGTSPGADNSVASLDAEEVSTATGTSEQNPSVVVTFELETC